MNGSTATMTTCNPTDEETDTCTYINITYEDNGETSKARYNVLTLVKYTVTQKVPQLTWRMIKSAKFYHLKNEIYQKCLSESLSHKWVIVIRTLRENIKATNQIYVQ